MTSNDEKKVDESFDEFIAEATSSSTSSRSSLPNDQGNRFSNRLESLLKFIDEKENNDVDFVETSAYKRYNNGYDSCGVHRGLVDNSNSTGQPSHQSTTEGIVGQNEKAFKNNSGANDSAFLGQSANKSKRYVWDEWEERDLVRDMSLNDGVPAGKTKHEMAAGDNKTESVSRARQQLISLKAMGEEIHARAASLKSSLEEKNIEIERLHCLRIQNEADHVKAMKSLKRQWKERKIEMKTKHDEASLNMTKDGERVQYELTALCQKLEKKEQHLRADIAKSLRSEDEVCDQLKAEGELDIQQCQHSWQQGEEIDFRKREQKLSSKLKRDAARAVEPKLRQLMENNKEELDRLQREATREIDCYRLELLRKINEEFKMEADKIREAERRRMEKLESEWMLKVQEMRRNHGTEMDKERREHEQRAKLNKQQYNADRQRCIDRHEVDRENLRRAREIEVEQLNLNHEREMSSMESEYKEEIKNRQNECQIGFKKWIAIREKELCDEERNEVKQEEAKMNQKMQSDIELVAKKLNEETREKRKRMTLEMKEKCKSVKDAQRKELDSAEADLDKAEAESSALTIQETEHSSVLSNMQGKIKMIKTAIQEKEDEVLLQENALCSFATECEEIILDRKKQGKRDISLARSDLLLLEKSLDDLIATHPHCVDERNRELNALKTKHAEEIQIAQGKVAAMLDKKKIMIEYDSRRLESLQRDVKEIERQIDEARSTKILKDCQW
ncbi:hypothetical protein HJC23_003129 [Cyclotella cryptica]|uniref:Uncharacterized protein n=1 Tax=Cyclotella cryptica TaxID=29204 RepID=A0ABD3P6C1_9STRA